MSTYKLSNLELVPIFVKEKDPLEGLFSVQFDKYEKHELERLFDKWNDANEVLSYFLFNEEYLKNPFFENYTIDDLSRKVQEEAAAIEEFLLAFAATNHTGNRLVFSSLFKPLDNSLKHFGSEELQTSKLQVKDKIHFRQPILRLYGLRIDENVFIVTGGAIKLTHYMDQHPDTREELNKLEYIRNLLLDAGVGIREKIIKEYYEQG